MKMNKTYYPIMAAACLAFGALIPMSSGDENQESPTIKATPVAKDDRMLKELNSELIDPLNEQAKLWGSFSRRGPTHDVSYYLVENSEKESAAERSFTVMMKQTPLSKTGKEKTSEYLKLRYQTALGKRMDQARRTGRDSQHRLRHQISRDRSEQPSLVTTRRYPPLR